MDSTSRAGPDDAKLSLANVRCVIAPFSTNGMASPVGGRSCGSDLSVAVYAASGQNAIRAEPRTLLDRSVMAAALWASYKEWADVQETLFLDWADPSGQYKLSPMQNLPGADFATAFAICVAYVAFVVIGTLVMKAGVPAIKTSPLQFLYNPLQVVLCSYMCMEAGILAYRNGYSATPCNAFNAEKPIMGNVMYMFYLSKILDFFDTIFIILGKKWKQLSFLHVYHHLTIFAIYFMNFRVAYDGDIYATIILNGFIHTIMYMYYFVSAHTRDIWWKKYLTAMQLIQFVTMNVQGYLMVSRSCDNFPHKVPVIYLVYIQSLFWLFMNFFVKSYCAKPRKSGKKKMQ